MLLRFGVSNHRSIRDYQEIIFTASSLKDADHGLMKPYLVNSDGLEDTVGEKLQVLPVTAIYGANAAGKSTILKAFSFFVDSIIYSHAGRKTSAGTFSTPFLLDEESREQPSAFDADFIVDGNRYHYGFTLNGKRILAEWLYEYPLNSKRLVRRVLFHRNPEEGEEFYFGKTLKGENKTISKLVRDNSLFLSAAVQNAHPQLTRIFNFFEDKISHRLEDDHSSHSISRQVYAYFGNDQEGLSKAINFLQAADVGISSVKFSQKPIPQITKQLLKDMEEMFRKHVDTSEDLGFSNEDQRPEVKLLHIGENRNSFPIELGDESSGTLALLQILGPVFKRLTEGGVLLVDELNISLHPLVSKELVKLFSHPDTNPGKAQLIFTTHDTSMLVTKLLRRDQIWFVEKDNDGASVIYSLSSIKVRSTDNFERGYMEGRFGAVPLFGTNISSPLELQAIEPRSGEVEQ